MAKKNPSYRLHKSSGQAVVTINGKDFYLGRHGTKESRNAYNRLIREWKSSKCAASFGCSDNVTVAMLAVDYLEHCKSHYPDQSNNETNQTDRAIRFLGDYVDCMVSEFGPLKLKAVRQAMLDAKHERTGNPLTRQYINKMVDRIKRMFSWGVENELVDISVYQSLSKVRGLQKGRTTAPEADPVRPVDDQIVDKTIEQCTPVISDMVRVQQLTGMRPGEVCCLTPGMIDRSEGVWVANLPKHKTAWRGKNRAIYIGPQAQQILLKYLSRGENEALFSPRESEEWRLAQIHAARKTPPNQGNRPGYSARARKGNPAKRHAGDSYNASSYGKAIRYACSQAFPVPEGATEEEELAHRKRYWWSPNRLRHSAATKLRKQHGIESARILLGHGSASTTEIYAEIDEQKAIEIAAASG